MNENTKKELQSATFERLLKHLDERKDVQNIDIMNLAGFCRNCLSRWYREEAEKKNISISDSEAREHVYGMPYPEWKKKYIFIGFSAWLLLIPLAITSSQKMIKILGRNWKNLHRLVYVIAIFGSLHYIWLSKTIFFKPLVYTLIIVVLFALRIRIKKRDVNYG